MVRCTVIQFVFGEFYLLLDAVLTIARHGPEKPQTQLGKKGLLAPVIENVIGTFCVKYPLGLDTWHSQQSEASIWIRRIQLQECLR